ncbi:DNA mismatch repair protein MutS [Candidatus Laterigemmans baculatus]|uniref:DNA mismatch repair protein MutS n=1 Tax=Candidatus Laterigemmans baculatus TaxID=2770505 RepID=UPI001F172EA9|nr:DNA mismatch repair protein MutS [Candidatus Laterigemmans baculatus]
MTTPMMRQYHEAKQACGDALLLFRMGDFYELFHEDAKIAAKVLGLTLTSRDREKENGVPMAGFPHHQLDAYLRKLIRAGYRAAVCEQVEDPKQAKGLVRREVTRVVSAGTLTDDQLLDPREANYLVAVYRSQAKRSSSKGASSKGVGNDGESELEQVGVAWAELSSGRFEAGVFPLARLDDELERIGPAEVLYREDDPRLSPDTTRGWQNTLRPAWTFAAEEATRTLTKQFGVANLEGYGFGDEHEPAIQAAGAVLAYLRETQPGGLDHFTALLAHHRSAVVEIDAATRRSLELSRTIRSGARDGSLLAVLDQTVTAMGSRLLGGWLSAPLTDAEAIAARHDAVGELVKAAELREEIRKTFAGVFDLSRLLGRVATGRTGPRDLQQVGRTLAMLPRLKERLGECQSPFLKALEGDLHVCPELQSRLEEGLVDECPLAASDGGFIRPGFDESLDALRELAAGGKQWIAAYQAKQIEETQIPNIKVGFNKVFGYYLEVTNAHKDKVPASFIRKQTLKNCERYITPELKEYEEKVLAADDEASSRELELFQALRDDVHRHLQQLQLTAGAIAGLDVVAGLAELAARRGWVRPEMSDSVVLDIEEGRHPVLDAMLPQGEFVPNDCQASAEDGMLMIITGPNMAGKSTYIRQVALLTLLAHVGAFVPAKRATIGLTDRIFARVGASDELARGQSTFMVEMVETARILNTATARSLVILDEIGRGTSTYDGLSLAWAITEHLHERIGCRTLFATHYHELTQLSDTLPRVVNLNVAVREWDDHVVFLHRIIRGSADKSYGIHVARLAGIPSSVNERAKDILAQLEEDHRDQFDRPTIAPPKTNTGARSGGGALQMTLFGYCDHPVLDDLKNLDLDSLTPLDALRTLEAMKKKLYDAPAVSR